MLLVGVLYAKYIKLTRPIWENKTSSKVLEILLMIVIMGILELGISIWLICNGTFLAIIGAPELFKMLPQMIIVCFAFGLGVMIASLIVAFIFKMFRKFWRRS